MPNDLLQQILNKVIAIEEKVNSTDITIKAVQSQLQEQGLVLRALEHKTDVIPNKASLSRNLRIPT